MRCSSPVLSRLFLCALIPAAVTGSSAYAQEVPAPDAASATLRLELIVPVKLKLGSLVIARTVEALYSSNKISIPAGTVVSGRGAHVTPEARNQRISAMSHGDFTPLHEAAIKLVLV